VTSYADQMAAIGADADAAIATKGQKPATTAQADAARATGAAADTALANTQPPPPPPPKVDYLVGSANGGNGDPSAMESRLGVKIETRRTYFRAASGATGSEGSITSAMKTVDADIAAGRKCSEISFKLPFSWADMAAGKGDGWLKAASDAVKAKARANPNHIIRVVKHHEPENDPAPDNGPTQAGHDNWKRVQEKAAPMYDGVPNVEFGCILMGFHSFSPPTSKADAAIWNLAASIPDIAGIKFVGFDIYESYGRAKSGGGYSTTWQDYEGKYFAPIEAWNATRTHKVKWGLSECGLVQRAFDADPNWFNKVGNAMKKHGGSHFSYFNSNLNSTDTWAFVAGDSREKAFGAFIKSA